MLKPLAVALLIAVVLPVAAQGAAKSADRNWAIEIVNRGSAAVPATTHIDISSDGNVAISQGTRSMSADLRKDADFIALRRAVLTCQPKQWRFTYTHKRNTIIDSSRDDLTLYLNDTPFRTEVDQPTPPNLPGDLAEIVRRINSLVGKVR